MSDQRLPDDLGSQQVVSPEEIQFFSDLAIIIPNPQGQEGSQWQEVDPQRLQEPSTFYGNLAEINLDLGDIAEFRNGLERGVVNVNHSDPQALFAESLETRFQIAEYEVSPQGSLGGGLLYQLTRDGVTGYLSLVPTTDSNGVAAFLWSQSPQ